MVTRPAADSTYSPAVNRGSKLCFPSHFGSPDVAGDVSLKMGEMTVEGFPTKRSQDWRTRV